MSFSGEGWDVGGIKSFSHHLRKVIWPPTFKPSMINKYDGSTKPAEWLEVYPLAIEATGGDPYVMANYLSIRLSSLARTWLMGLPTGLLIIICQDLAHGAPDRVYPIMVGPVPLVHQQLLSHL
jgi:hypothetical protein